MKNRKNIIIALTLFVAGIPILYLVEQQTHIFSKAAGVLTGTVQEFDLVERFGVSHPNQLIDFDLGQQIDPQTTSLIDQNGTPIPYQLLNNNRIVIQTDLQSNASKKYTLKAGSTPAPMNNGINITETATYYEITNGLTGVRVPKPVVYPDKTLAPVQGIKYQDGTWTATGPNYTTANVAGKPAALTMNTEFLEKGPLKTVMLVSYTFTRPNYDYGEFHIDGGPGSHKTRIEVQAGQPSILFKEDTDMDLEYSLNMHQGLQPTQARWRGYDGGSIDAGYEYDSSGNKIAYRSRLDRGSTLDAIYDLKFDRDYRTNYLSSPGNIKRLSNWALYPNNTGLYWQMYNQNGASDNLLGIFAGKASDLIGAHDSGPGFYTKQSGSEAGITFQSNRRGPDNTIAPHISLSWGLFIGRKSRDLWETNSVQPINRQMNLHSGINLNKIHKIPVDYPDPPQGYGGLFMDKSVTEEMIRKIQADPSPASAGNSNSYAGYLYLADSGSLALLNMWQDKTPATAEKLVQNLTGDSEYPSISAKVFLETMVNGNGVLDWDSGYWKYAISRVPLGTWMDQILGNPQVSTASKAKIKAVMSLYAHVIWDEDFAPVGSLEKSGAQFGTANMPYMVRTGRNFYASLLSEAPTMKDHFSKVIAETKQTINDLINDSGSHIGSVHYNEASIGTTLHTMLQMKMRGVDLFKSEPKVTKYAEFYKNFLTPPEPRFGNVRKLVAIGDGATESSTILGKLGSGFAGSNPDLSAALMDGWQKSGKRHDSFFGSSLLMINEAAPTKPLTLKSANFPGYYSVLRSGGGTDKETGVWFINGDWYSDHRHDDQGSLIAYALGSPLMIDWGSFYSPRVPRSYMHSMIVREKDLTDSKNVLFPWNQDNVPLELPSYGKWVSSKQADTNGFVDLPDSSTSNARFTTKDGLVWNRRVQNIHPNSDYPILLVNDTFEGADTGSTKISTLNLMAEGTVQTPGGPITPVLRTYKNGGELPSTGSVFPLSAGLNKLSFTGQKFGKNSESGIDWDLYTYSKEQQQALIGNWADNSHPSNEEAQYLNYNDRTFEERQDILRIKGTGPFNTIIMPNKKGQKRNTAVSESGGVITAVTGDETVKLSDNFYYFKNPSQIILTSFSSQIATFDAFSISGGPTEIESSINAVKITAHGNKGVRRLKFPGSWNLPGGISKSGDEYTFDYQSNEPQTVTLTNGSVIPPTTAPTPTPGPTTSAPTPTIAISNTNPTPTPTPTPAATAPTPDLAAESPTPITASTPTPVPPAPTASPLTPTPTLQPNTLAMSLSIFLHGIGKGGDSSNPQSGGSANPLRAQRIAHVQVYNNENNLIFTKDSLITYDQTNGNFQGLVDVGTDFPGGIYTVKVKVDQFLKTLVPGIQNFHPGINPLPATTLTSGDVNNDNRIDILDYNIFIDCYSDLTPAKNCSDPAKKLSADITDDGAVNQYDYNLFLRELTNIRGE